MDLMARKKKLIMAQPHIVMPTPAPILTFNTDVKAPLKECKVYFAPVQEGSGDPSPTNVRPITGWTGIRAGTRTSNILNLLAEQAQSTPISSADTTKRSFVPGSCVIGISSNNYYRANYANYVEAIALTENSLSFTSGDASGYGIGYVLDGVKPGDSVKFSYGETENLNIYITAYEADGTFIGYQTVDNAARTVPEGASTVLLVMASAKSNKLCYVTNPKLELRTTDTPYEPYRGQTVAVDWTTEAGTVYGGYVDLVKGELVAEYGIFESTWGEMGDANIRGNYERRSKKISSLGFIGASAGNLNNRPDRRFCNIAPWRWDYNQDSLHYYFDNGYVFLFLPTNTESNVQVQVVGYLATPITYQLTPTQLKTLRGANNIWSNVNGNIEAAYWSH